MKWDEIKKEIKKPRNIVIALIAGGIALMILATVVSPQYSQMSTMGGHSDGMNNSMISSTLNADMGMEPQMMKGIAEKESRGMNSVGDDVYKPSATPEMKKESPSPTGTSITDNLKIIKTANINLEVLNFDDVDKKLREMAVNSGGYVESSSSHIYESYPDKKEYLKQGRITIKVPKDKYDEVKNSVSNIGKIILSSENTDNVTAKYIETEGRIKALEIEQDRIFDIMKKADKVEALIQLETRLSEIRSQLEVNKSQIANWDKLVSFSTIHIDIKQVRSESAIKPVDKNLGQRITESFVSSVNQVQASFEDGVVWLAGNFIILLIELLKWGIFITVIVVIVKKVTKKMKDKEE